MLSYPILAGLLLLYLAMPLFLPLGGCPDFGAPSGEGGCVALRHGRCARGLGFWKARPLSADARRPGGELVVRVARFYIIYDMVAV